MGNGPVSCSSSNPEKGGVMKRFPTMPCLVVTAILAVLLAIGFTMPFAAEAYPGGWSGYPVAYPEGVKKGVVNPDSWIPPDAKSDIQRVVEADIPLDPPRVKLKNLGLWPTGGGEDEAVMVADDRGYDVWRPNNDGRAKAFAGDVGVGMFVAGIKWSVGVVQSPKPPVKKTRDTMVDWIGYKGGGIGPDY